MSQLDPVPEYQMFGMVRDWQVIEAENFDSAIVKAKRISMITKCVSLTHLRLIISDPEQGEWLCNEIEDLLSSYVSTNDVVQKMVVAPYADPEKMKECAVLALGSGYGAIGGLFNKLYDLQPLIRRLSFVWLSLPIDRFFGGSSSKQEWWVRLYESGNLLEIIEAPDGHAIKRIFGNIAFNYKSPSDRESIASIGNELSHRLFGGVDDEYVLIDDREEDDVTRNLARSRGANLDNKEKLSRTLTEVDPIPDTVNQLL